MSVVVQYKTLSSGVHPTSADHVFAEGRTFQVDEGHLIVLAVGGRRLAIYTPGSWISVSVEGSWELSKT